MLRTDLHHIACEEIQVKTKTTKGMYNTGLLCKRLHGPKKAIILKCKGKSLNIQREALAGAKMIFLLRSVALAQLV